MRACPSPGELGERDGADEVSPEAAYTKRAGTEGRRSSTRTCTSGGTRTISTRERCSRISRSAVVDGRTRSSRRCGTTLSSGTSRRSRASSTRRSCSPCDQRARSESACRTSTWRISSGNTRQAGMGVQHRSLEAWRRRRARTLRQGMGRHRGRRIGPCLSGFYLNDPVVYPFYEKPQELEVPLVVHAGPPSRRTCE